MHVIITPLYPIAPSSHEMILESISQAFSRPEYDPCAFSVTDIDAEMAHIKLSDVLMCSIQILTVNGAFCSARKNYRHH